MPPPYEKVEKIDSIQKWEKESNVTYFNEDGSNNSSQNSLFNERCCSCFDAMKNEEVASQNGKFYHKECFRKKFGPKCSYCLFPLTDPDKDCDLSGQYLVYKDKTYHVECYEKYAGPRCTYCFDVIIEKPKGDFSGNWVVDGHKEYHVECYQRKMKAKWHADNA